MVPRRRAAGTAPAVLGGGLANVLVLPAGDDVIVVDASAEGVHGRGAGQPRPDAAVGAGDARRRAGRGDPRRARALVDLARVIVAAEAAGIASECTEQAAAYAKVREQFGRPIATFQAVKHHCANMLVASELATAAVWDAARAADDGGDQLTYAAAMAAALALAAATSAPAQHAGPRRDRLHVGARRPPVPPPGHRARGGGRPRGGGREVTDLVRRRARGRARSTCRPRPSRSATRCGRSPSAIKGLDDAAQREAMIETGLRHAALAQALGA